MFCSEGCRATIVISVTMGVISGGTYANISFWFSDSPAVFFCGGADSSLNFNYRGIKRERSELQDLTVRWCSFKA